MTELDPRRRFSRSQRTALFVAANGRCERCGIDLPESWHADHAVPHALGGATEIYNGRALCPECNLKKGTKMELRKWQQRALRSFGQLASPDFLLEACPGAGKTVFAAHAIRPGVIGGTRAVIVVPTEHLKRQWAESLHEFGIDCEPEFPNGNPWPRDMHAVAATYQQMASAPSFFARHAAGQSVILDEIHHCGNNKPWGDALRAAFGPASLRLMLSGTPFRSDGSPIPFVKYVDGRSAPDFRHTYRDALRDDPPYVRMIHFPHIDGTMEWSYDGNKRTARFSDPLSDEECSRRLQTALMPTDGGMLDVMFGKAHRRLMELREEDPSAAGLVLAKDQDHARECRRLLMRHGATDPVVVTSSDPEASKRIGAFKDSNQPWLVSVRMVSEGVDIPRIRVIAWATNVITEMFFRQAVGRAVRGPGDHACVYIPDDERLAAFAAAVHDDVSVCIDEIEREVCEREVAERDPDAPRRFFPEDCRDGEQIRMTSDGESIPQDEIDRAAESIRRLGLRLDPIEAARWYRHHKALEADGEVILPKKPRLLADDKDRKRSRCNHLVNAIAHRHGISHRDINTALNRRLGKKISSCTVSDLERRIELSEAWLRCGVAP